MIQLLPRVPNNGLDPMFGNTRAVPLGTGNNEREIRVGGKTEIRFAMRGVIGRLGGEEVV